ncbi:MAG: pentapeptide repeat-containing protein [Acidimicrobiales bacterium]
MWRVLGLVVVGVGVSACHQNGTVFAVDTTADTVDVVPGDGVCADAGGACSLRAAVMEANALPGVEEIRLVDGAEYTLTIPEGTTDTAATGDLDITSPVVMTGDGRIIGRNLGGLIHVREGVGLVELSGPNFGWDAAALTIDAPSSVSVRSADFTYRSGGYPGDSEAIRVNGGSLSVWSSSISRGIDCCTGDTLVNAIGGSVYLENVTMQGGYDRLVTALNGVVTVRSSTFVGGQVVMEPSGTGSIAVTSSIVDSTCTGSITSGGHNLDRCGFAASGDVAIAGSPTVGLLSDHGGDVLTFAIPPDGQAVDAGPSSGCAAGNIDARGTLRPWGPACDIGAFEVQYGGDCSSPGPGANLRYCDFSGADLSGIDLSGAAFANATLDHASFVGATLTGADFTEASVVETDFGGADLTDATLTRARGGFFADNANLTRANLRNTGARSVDGANFTDADAVGFGTWVFIGSMVGAHIEGADFTSGSFIGVTSGGITGTATFSPQKGVVNGYLIDQAVDISGLDFSGVDFGDIELTNVRAVGTDLSDSVIKWSWGAVYDDATLDRTSFVGAYGANSSFQRVSLVSADMSAAELESTSWRGATIADSAFTASHVWGAEFIDATVVFTDFTDVDLSRADFTRAVLAANTWSNTTCPSGVNSDDNGGNCDGQFTWGAPA